MVIFCNYTIWPGNMWALSSGEVSLASLSNDDDDHGDGNENRKKAIGLDRQNNNFARASRFFVHFLAVVARLRRETDQFHVLSKTGTQNNKFLFLFLNFDIVLWNPTPKKFPNI